MTCFYNVVETATEILTIILRKIVRLSIKTSSRPISNKQPQKKRHLLYTVLFQMLNRNTHYHETADDKQ